MLRAALLCTKWWCVSNQGVLNGKHVCAVSLVIHGTCGPVISVLLPVIPVHVVRAGTIVGGPPGDRLFRVVVCAAAEGCLLVG